MEKWFLYILKCRDGSLYTGVTKDVDRRFLEHKNKKGGHYTSSHEVNRIIHLENYPTMSDALKREMQIKGWSRKKKLNLIKNNKLPA